MELNEMLKWGIIDEQELELIGGYISVAENLGITPEDIAHSMSSQLEEKRFLSSWFRAYMDFTFAEVSDRLESMVEELEQDSSIKDKLTKEIYRLRHDFEPEVSYLRSRYNNLLDDYDLSDRNVVGKIYEELRQGVEKEEMSKSDQMHIKLYKVTKGRKKIDQETFGKVQEIEGISAKQVVSPIHEGESLYELFYDENKLKRYLTDLIVLD